MPKELKVLNSKGEPIVLNDMETRVADILQRTVNSLGMEIPITTFTQITKKVAEQKFYEIPFAEYVPVIAGEGAWATNLLTFRSMNLGGPFEEGYTNTATGNTSIPSVDAGVDSVSQTILTWNKGIQWSLPEMQFAARQGNWDLVTSKEKARKTNFDLGIQRICFNGANGIPTTMGTVLGLLTQTGVTNNTTAITKAISSMTTAEFKTFAQAILAAYRANCFSTAWPNRFVIPESDYLGLAGPLSPDFPIKGSSALEVLEGIFQTMTMKKDFRILPLKYADSTSPEPAVSGKQMYALYNYDEDSIKFSLPVPYTATVANSINGYTLQNVAYAQHTGVLAVRPAELMYFSF